MDTKGIRTTPQALAELYEKFPHLKAGNFLFRINSPRPEKCHMYVFLAEDGTRETYTVDSGRPGKLGWNYTGNRPIVDRNQLEELEKSGRDEREMILMGFNEV